MANKKDDVMESFASDSTVNYSRNGLNGMILKEMYSLAKREKMTKKEFDKTYRNWMNKEKTKRHKITHKRVMKTHMEQAVIDSKSQLCLHKSKRRHSRSKRESSERADSVHSRLSRKKEVTEKKIFVQRLKKCVKKEEEIKKNCTFKPAICSKSKLKVKNRSVKDLMEWNDKRIEKTRKAVELKQKAEIDSLKIPKSRPFKRSSSCKKVFAKVKNKSRKMRKCNSRSYFEASRESSFMKGLSKKKKKNVKQNLGSMGEIAGNNKRKYKSLLDKSRKSELVENVEQKLKELEPNQNVFQKDLNCYTNYEAEIIPAEAELAPKGSYLNETSEEEGKSPFHNSTIISKISKNEKPIRKSRGGSRSSIRDGESNLFSTFGNGREVLAKGRNHKDLLNQIIEDRRVTNLDDFKRRMVKKKKAKRRRLLEQAKRVERTCRRKRKNSSSKVRKNSRKNSRKKSKGSKRRLSSVKSIRSRKNSSLALDLKIPKLNQSGNKLGKENLIEESLVSKAFNKWENDQGFNPDVLKDFIKMKKRSTSNASRTSVVKKKSLARRKSKRRPKKSQSKSRISFR